VQGTGKAIPFTGLHGLQKVEAPRKWCCQPYTLAAFTSRIPGTHFC